MTRRHDAALIPDYARPDPEPVIPRPVPVTPPAAPEPEAKRVRYPEGRYSCFGCGKNFEPADTRQTVFCGGCSEAKARRELVERMTEQSKVYPVVEKLIGY